MSSARSDNSRDVAIARRLLTIVLSDFLCWFPVGLLGLLASSGTPISSEVSVGMAIFVLPFNSALNPFFYTFNVVMEKRKQARRSRLSVTETKVEARAQCPEQPVVNSVLEELERLKEQIRTLSNSVHHMSTVRATDPST
nr:hypothetical protein BaRGS_013639 [Batillaria attramentaria]